MKTPCGAAPAAGVRRFAQRANGRAACCAVALGLNLAYAVYHGVLGAIETSMWFMAMCAFYAIFAAMRFCAVLCARDQARVSCLDTQFFIMRVCGALLLALSFVFATVVYLSLSQDTGARRGEIAMIAIATYTFSKIALTLARGARARRSPSPLSFVLQGIGYAEIATSVLTLQRSMLASFGAMPAGQARTMNALTGAAVYLLVLALGVCMLAKGIRKGMKHMTKSKLVRANEKVAETVCGAYKKIEGAVTGGYAKLEGAFVSSYTKVEDAFVDRYLKRDGETVDEAKQRLKGGR